MAQGDGAAVWPSRRSLRYGGWSIPCSRCFLPGLTASLLLSYQGCSRALDCGLRWAQRRPAPAQPNRSASCEVTSRAVAGQASEVRAGYGGRYGRPRCPAGKPGRDHRSSPTAPDGLRLELGLRSLPGPGPAAKTVAAMPRLIRARTRLVESVKRLLLGPVDNIGEIFRERVAAVSVLRQSCRRFPAILPNSAGCVKA